MKINAKAWIFVVGCAVLTAEVPSPAAIVTNLLLDAGFENLSTNQPNSGSSPWSDNISAEEAHIQIRTGVAHSGFNSLAFNNYTRGGYVMQKVGQQVQADRSYELSVWMMLDEKSSTSTHTNATTINMALATSSAANGTYDWTGIGRKLTAPTVVGEWQKFTFVIDSTNLTALVGQWMAVRFVKESPIPTEYRIFLDDASFGAVIPEPATIGMLILGAGITLFTRYRLF